jgi:myo-inositol-1(or 4)-monophosphatase
MFNSSSLEQLCLESCKIIREVGDFIYQELGKVKASSIETKALNSLVSYVDKEAEKQLVTGLGKLLPEATFLTEEETVEQKEGQYRWIIDPLDGTTNFLHQLPFFCVSVGLEHDGKLILGIIYEPIRQECFYGWKDGGAYLNGDSISVSKTDQLSDALLATGFPYYDYSAVKAYLGALEQLMQSSRGIRRLGSAALDLAYVACGRFDAFFEYSLNPWDVAAGAFLVTEAGGRVTDFSGGNDYLHGKQLIASNKGIADSFSEIIQQLFFPMG